MPLFVLGMEITDFNYSEHVYERMAKRKIMKDQVEWTLKNGKVISSKKPGYAVYCSSKKGLLRVVVKNDNNLIVTAYYGDNDEVLTKKEKKKKNAKALQNERIKELEAKGMRFMEPSIVENPKGLTGKELAREARSAKYQRELDSE